MMMALLVGLVALGSGSALKTVGVSKCIGKMIARKDMNSTEIIEYISERYRSRRGSVR